jgi:putative zinc finger protein
MSECKSQALSWLRLEMYNLQELPDAEVRQVENHLADCESCRSCLDRIKQSTDELKPLPRIELESQRSGWFSLAWIGATASLAAAAILLIVFKFGWPDQVSDELPPPKIAYKGGELTISLVRDRDGVIKHEPEAFISGDRFKVLVTCPPSEELYWDLVVIQNDELFFPLAPSDALSCGNRVGLPNAFKLSGVAAATICLVTSPQVPDRTSISIDWLESVPADTVCLQLRSQADR